MTQNQWETRVSPSAQTQWRDFAFQRRSREGYLRWMSKPLCWGCVDPVRPCAVGVLCSVLPCFDLWFLQPVTSIGTSLITPFLCLNSASFCTKRLWVFLCVCVVIYSFPLHEWNNHPVAFDSDLLTVILGESSLADYSWLYIYFCFWSKFVSFKCRNKYSFRKSLSVVISSTLSDFESELVCICHLKANSKLYKKLSL